MNLAELFARDPREHSDEDVRRIIAELRKAREKFIFEGPQRKTQPKTEKQKALAGIQLDIKL